jgi:hypothetical protein
MRRSKCTEVSTRLLASSMTDVGIRAAVGRRRALCATQQADSNSNSKCRQRVSALACKNEGGPTYVALQSHKLQAC